MIRVLIVSILIFTIARANVLFKNVSGETSYLIGLTTGILYTFILDIINNVRV